MSDPNTQKNNPLHGVTLKAMLQDLVDRYGWDHLGQRVDIRCFNHDPSINSSLKFLRRTPWAREKVEELYLLSMDDVVPAVVKKPSGPPVISLKVAADQVAVLDDEDFCGLFFGQGDAEDGGEHWNFSRMHDDGGEDDGVCVVKEIQQLTFYEGITSLVLSRNQLICQFDEKGEEQTGFDVLNIRFTIDDAQWTEMCTLAAVVFRERSYFELEQ